MPRVLPLSLLFVWILPQACHPGDATAPRPHLEADGGHGRARARLAFVTQPPQAVEANAVISPAVQVSVTDASGDVVSGGHVRLELESGASAGGTLSGTTKVKIVDGVASFTDLRIDRPGLGYTLRAVALGSSGASTRFAVVGPPARLVFVTQPPAALAEGGAMSPAVRIAIEDALGSTVPSATNAVTLAFAANPSGATLAGTTTVQAVNGLATFADLRLDRPGSGYTLAAAVPSLAGATSAPFAVYLAFRALSTAVQGSHTCAVTTDNAAFCWGQNSAGNLGDGTRVDRLSPVLVSGGLPFAGVSAGALHTCGVTQRGEAYCWGANLFGQLGDGSSTDRSSPASVAAGVQFIDVKAAFFYYSCGVATGGAAYCWGNNEDGELGDGTTTARNTPAPVAGGLSFVTVSGGFRFACGVTTSQAAYCWGTNEVGQLGIGTTAGPEHCIVDSEPQDCSTRPVPVSGQRTFVELSAGGGHTCGLTPGGAAYCWGAGFPGQLGDGSGVNRPNPTLVTGGLIFRVVSAGLEHTCGVTTSGAAYCWGYNGDGQLGDGTTTDQRSPVPVSGGQQFVTVSAGNNHSCALTARGMAYCWGRGGRLGDGTANASLTPVPVVPRTIAGR